MMCLVIHNPTSCEICALIHCLHTKNMSDAEIHRQLCAAVYGRNVMSERTIRQCQRMFKEGWTNVYDNERNSRPSVASDGLVQSVDQKICERWCFTISEILCEFPQISCTLLCEIITVRLDHHKFCQGEFWKCKRVHTKCREWLSFDFFRTILQSDETWVSFVIVETKEQLKQWTHTQLPRKPKKFKHTFFPESWWHLFSGTGKERWWWNLCIQRPQCHKCAAKHLKKTV
jgi:hypothetical protein